MGQTKSIEIEFRLLSLDDENPTAVNGTDLSLYETRFAMKLMHEEPRASIVLVDLQVPASFTKC